MQMQRFEGSGGDDNDEWNKSKQHLNIQTSWSAILIFFFFCSFLSLSFFQNVNIDYYYFLKKYLRKIFIQNSWLSRFWSKLCVQFIMPGLFFVSLSLSLKPSLSLSLVLFVQWDGAWILVWMDARSLARSLAHLRTRLCCARHWKPNWAKHVWLTKMCAKIVRHVMCHSKLDL